jgi:predicted metal-binding membrane protein
MHAVSVLRAPLDRRGVLLVGGAAVAAAWIALAAWGRSDLRYLLGHERLGTVGLPALGGLMAGWVLMTVAMMLPASMPLIAWFHGLARGRARHGGMVLLLVGGYLATWAVFGVAVHAGDWVLHRAGAALPFVAAGAWALAPGALVVAGLWQFTPLKRRCLRRCCMRPELSVEQWAADARPARLALRLGVQEGVWTLGCCWALMLLMMVGGMSSLAHMLALGAVMLVEKSVQGSRRLTAPLGVCLLAAGVVAFALHWA